MTNQSEAPAVAEAIVVCGTCDGVYRMHAGRTNCPHCGGEPSLVVTAIETPAEEPEPVDLLPAEPPAPPPAGEPEPAESVSPPESVVDVSRGSGDTFPPAPPEP